jgi:hypothetical protein
MTRRVRLAAAQRCDLPQDPSVLSECDVRNEEARISVRDQTPKAHEHALLPFSKTSADCPCICSDKARVRIDEARAQCGESASCVQQCDLGLPLRLALEWRLRIRSERWDDDREAHRERRDEGADAERQADWWANAQFSGHNSQYRHPGPVLEAGAAV